MKFHSTVWKHLDVLFICSFTCVRIQLYTCGMLFVYNYIHVGIGIGKHGCQMSFARAGYFELNCT